MGAWRPVEGVARVEIDRWSHFRRCVCVAVRVMITSCRRRPCLVRLGYSPIGCCVPGLGLETSNPWARALNSAISTRLDSTRLDPAELRAGMAGGPTADIGCSGEERRWVLRHGSWGGKKGQFPGRSEEGKEWTRGERSRRFQKSGTADGQTEPALILPGRKQATSRRARRDGGEETRCRTGLRRKSRGRASSSSGHVSI